MTLALQFAVAACGSVARAAGAEAARDEARRAVVQEHLDRWVQWQEQAAASALSSCTGEGTAEERMPHAEARRAVLRARARYRVSMAGGA